MQLAFKASFTWKISYLFYEQRNVVKIIDAILSILYINTRRKLVKMDKLVCFGIFLLFFHAFFIYFDNSKLLTLQLGRFFLSVFGTRIVRL